MVTGWQRGMVNGSLAWHGLGATGRQLVLVHGLGDAGPCWARVANALADRWRVIMPDARGHGDSARMVAGASADPAGDLAAVIMALGDGPVDLLGHSVGARAAAQCAADHPALVRRLVLVDPPLLAVPDAATLATRRAGWQAQVAAFHAMTPAQLHAAWRSAHPDWDECEFAAWAASKRQVDPAALPPMDRPWQQAIAPIAVPTLLLHGASARGSLVSPAAAREARAINPLIRCVEIAEAGHNVHREAFDAFVGQVRDFFERGF